MKRNLILIVLMLLIFPASARAQSGPVGIAPQGCGELWGYAYWPQFSGWGTMYAIVAYGEQESIVEMPFYMIGTGTGEDIHIYHAGYIPLPGGELQAAYIEAQDASGETIRIEADITPYALPSCSVFLPNINSGVTQ